MQPFKMLTQHSEIASSNCLSDVFMYCFFALSGSLCRCFKSGRKVRMRCVVIRHCSPSTPAFDDGDQDHYEYENNFDQKQIQVCNLDSSLTSFGDDQRLRHCVHTMQRRRVK